MVFSFIFMYIESHFDMDQLNTHLKIRTHFPHEILPTCRNIKWNSLTFSFEISILIHLWSIELKDFDYVSVCFWHWLIFGILYFVWTLHFLYRFFKYFSSSFASQIRRIHFWIWLHHGWNVKKYLSKTFCINTNPSLFIFVMCSLTCFVANFRNNSRKSSRIRCNLTVKSICIVPIFDARFHLVLFKLCEGSTHLPMELYWQKHLMPNRAIFSIQFLSKCQQENSFLFEVCCSNLT